MGGPGLATKHHWMRVPMTEFPDTTNFAACGGYRAEIGFCRFLWLRNSGWPRQAFSPFFTALAASRHDGACVERDAGRLQQARQERLTLKAGTTVTWRNEDDIPHNVTSANSAVQVEGAPLIA